MGKGYKQWAALDGTDLKEHFQDAFKRKVGCPLCTLFIQKYS